METIVGFLLFGVIMSAFYTGAALLFYSYLVVVITTVGLHTYDCLGVLVAASGTCQEYADVIDNVVTNMAAITAAFVITHTGLAIIRKMLPRL